MGSCDYSICHKDVSLVLSQTSFVFLTSLVSRVERVCIGFISSKAEEVALFL